MITALRRSSPEQLFESLYKRHAQDVYRYSLALLHRQADAEDATQTTFMNAYRAIGKGERPRDAGKWLRAIALNVCREHYRRAGRRPAEISLDEDPAELVLDPPTPTIGDVVRGLAVLPFNQRAALVMREFEGRSVAEVAAALEVSPSAVEALLFRARRALREQLEEQLTCAEAEQAISRQLDHALPRSERGPLRAHLRSCDECASFARRMRAQRSAIRSLGLLPIPISLSMRGIVRGAGATASAAGAGQSVTGAGGSVIASLVGSAAAKVAALTVVGAAVVGVGYESLHNTHPQGAGIELSARAPAHTSRGATPASAHGRGASAGATAASVRIALRPAHRLRSTWYAAAVHTPAGSGSRHASPAAGSRSHLNPGRPTATHSPSRPGGGAVSNPGHSSSPHQQAPGHSGVSPGVGHVYGHSKPKHFKATPPGHAYGHTKPKKTAPPVAVQAPPVVTPAPSLPPGLAKQPGTPAVGSARGHQK